MGKPIAHARIGGTCYSCGGPFSAGDPIWWAGYKRARHQACPETGGSAPANGGNRPNGPAEKEYVFTDREGQQKLDQLHFKWPGDMLERAFQISSENSMVVGVSRIEDGKAVALFMISAVAGAELRPRPKQEPIATPIEGPLFPWPEGEPAPF